MYKVNLLVRLILFSFYRCLTDLKFWKHILIYYRIHLSKKNNIQTIEINDVCDLNETSITINRLALSDGNISHLESLIITALASSLKKDQNFLEIGTFDGKTTINCASNLKSSIIYTIDLPEDEIVDEIERSNDYLEYDKALIMKKERRMKDFSNFSNIKQIYADSTKFDFSTINFTIAFIDGGHDLGTVCSDTTNCIKNIKKPGVIIWHDYDVTNPVGRYLQSIANKYDIKWVKDTRICISYIK